MEVQVQALGDFMHDAGLESIEADRRARTVRLVVDSDDLAECYKWPNTERLQILMEGVEKVACYLHALPPDPQSRGWRESVDWAHADVMLEGRVGTVLDAVLEKAEERATLRVMLVAGNTPAGYSDYWEIEISGAQLHFFLLEADREISLGEALMEDESE